MNFAVLDFETTGNQPGDQIIQIGLVLVDGDQITDRYTTLVQPGMRIPDSISRLTGITDEMVEEAPAISEVVHEMVSRVAGRIIVAHNAAFDVGFLQKVLAEEGYLPFDGRVLDTMDLLRILYPTISSYQLSLVSGAFGISHDRPHQADSDAEATAHIWLKCLDKLQSLPLLTVQRLGHLFRHEAGDLGWFLQEQARLKELQTALDEQSGSYFRQFSIHVQDWTDLEPLREEGEVPPEMNQEFAPFYEAVKDGLRAKFGDFQVREAQEQMLSEVEAAFDQKQHLMIEAGTGTGKSLGYLIPSLYYGIREGRKVVVSTHTINLQEQLRQRDIPLLHEIFPVPFRAAIMKGRNHYLCLRKFEQRVIQLELETDKEERISAAQLIVWLGETGHGEDDELNLAGKGRHLWQTVASDTDSCLNRACPWFKKCFYHRARQEANTADIVITNHSLLFTDVKAENRLLPSYKQLVIDEAHHFEEVASRHLGQEVFYGTLVNSLVWLYKDSKTGLLPQLRIRLMKENGTEKLEAWLAELDRLSELTIKIKEQWDQLTEQLFTELKPQMDGLGENNQLVQRMKKELLPEKWDDLLIMEDNIYMDLNTLLKQLDRLTGEWKENQEELSLQSLVTDVSGVCKDLQRTRDNLRFFMKMNDNNYVYWLEASPFLKSRSIHLNCAPVDVSKLLGEYIFEPKDSVIMTSATLSVDKSFAYSCEQLGLDAAHASGKLKTVQLLSPFNYREQALVIVPRDFPSVRGTVADQHFLNALVGSLKDIAVEMQGRMLVLFTSNRMLKQVHAPLKEQLSEHNISVLGQGVDSGNRTKLTKLFQNQPRAVLLGTSSFWEGVDIPGEALSVLAIVRLPFQPPTHPLVEAKCERIKQSGGNPFMRYSVPQAVIRFKQGFGRLVRKEKDKGIVILYDTRVIESSYGKYFLYSLPKPKIEHMPTGQLVGRIKEWMGETV
ncbi:ATP-dependent DNA helicase DinG [Paenibacillus sp. y28]|uniref:ATP-dependent DNA helicase DinG n=1 Tax=Paenibacillus sp. y28 TaxID=3129110 RepID=UPI003017F318